MVKLQTHQVDCIKAIDDYWKIDNRQLIQMPTGSGKTFVFLKYLSDKSKRSLIICPTRELQEQIADSALNFFHASEISTKESSKPKFKRVNIWVAQSIQLKFRGNLLDQQFDYIVIDEAHRAMSNMYRDFISSYSENNPNFRLLGFTATPERSDDLSLLDMFGKLTFSKNIFHLIEEKLLSDICGHRIKTFQLFNKKMGATGDIIQKNLKCLDNETRNNIIFKTYKENCLDKKTLIFCVSINHAENISNLLQSQGYAADYVSGKMSKSIRRKKLQDFKSGKIDVLCNCQLLTEGFDEPSIENLIIARPTLSKTLYCQMIGRGLRIYPGKKVCNLYELTDNVHDICTFNVAGNAPRQLNYEYRNGTLLSSLTKELESLTLQEVVLKKEKLNILRKIPCCFEEPAFNYQIQRMKKLGIKFMEPISFLEAAFLIWKHAAMEKYGINTKS